MMITNAELKMMAQAVIEEGLTYDSPSCGEPSFYCVFCTSELRGWSVKVDQFSHDSDCPVLTAEKIVNGEGVQ
jgi:hypothetical protein